MKSGFFSVLRMQRMNGEPVETACIYAEPTEFMQSLQRVGIKSLLSACSICSVYAEPKSTKSKYLNKSAPGACTQYTVEKMIYL